MFRGGFGELCQLLDDCGGYRKLAPDPVARFGDFQVVPDTQLSPAAEKTGFVEINEGVEQIFVSFDNPFIETSTSLPSDYIVVLTPDDNVQTWVSTKTDDGFIVNIEPNVGFTGKVFWVAIQFDTTNARSIDVSFDNPIPQIDGHDVDYTVFVTPSDNSLTWISDKTSSGFKINTERPFGGTITLNKQICLYLTSSVFCEGKR